MEYIREKLYQLFSRVFSREIIRDGFRGILGRDPEEEALNAYEGSFKELGVSGLTQELTLSKEAWEKQQAAHARELIAEVFQGILGREPDEKDLNVYKGRIGELRVEGVISDLIESGEAWDRQKSTHMQELIREAYQGIMGREPEEEALIAHSEEYLQHQNKKTESRLKLTLNKLIESEEFFYTLNTRRALWEKVQEKLLQSVYQGLLDRAPDETGRNIYSQALNKWEDLSIVISSVASGRGHMGKIIRSKSPEIFIDFCSRLLKRSLTPHEIKQAGVQFGNSSHLGDLLEGAIAKYYQEEAKIKRKISPIKGLKPKRVIFLHAEKTGGTSIQAMLSKTFSTDEIFCEHDDTIYWRSPSEINKYRVLCGHFNYDTTQLFTPGDNQLVTMVREPGKRILSLYNFWRAHQETHPNHTIYHSIAWEKGFAEFLEDERIILCRHVWNNMAWYIAGEEVWNEWRGMVNLSENEQKSYLATIVTPFLQKRMSSFAVIGIQEKFSESVSKIYQLLDKEPPTMMLKENSFDGNALSASHFRKDLTAQQIINEHEKKAISHVTKIDDIIYKLTLSRFNQK